MDNLTLRSCISDIVQRMRCAGCSSDEIAEKIVEFWQNKEKKHEQK